MKIERLKVNRLKEPLGFCLEEPRVSWVVTKSTGKKAAWSRVQLALDADFGQIVYDSGERVDLDAKACPLPVELAPRTRYHWRVTVRADDGDEGSAESWFETGKMDEAYLGRWIAAPLDKDIHPVFRRDFTLEQAPAGGRVFMCGLGVYELYLNGRRVGEEALAPFYNDYELWLQAQTYDIGRLLQPGRNRLEVWLGNGWYKGRFGFVRDMRELYGDQMKLLLELRVQLAGGEEFLLGSDESFLCQGGPVLESSIYDGESYDARKERLDEAAFVHAVPAPAPKGRLQDRLSPRLLVQERRKAVRLLRTPAGEDVLDFGQVMSGWVEMQLSLPAGAKVELDYGELLQNDCFYNENLRTAKQHYSYISNGKPALARPHFTFYGFRYVRVKGLNRIDLQDFTACVVHSDLEPTGWLSTSNEKVNRLYQNALWSQRGNFLDTPTDCPQRDERMGWTGDAQVFAPTASFNMDTAAFYDKYLYDMALEQKQLGGAVPHVVPDVLDQIARLQGRPAHEYGSCAWADAAVLIPWTLYRFFGDKIRLKKQFPQMAAWVDWVQSQDETNFGGPRLWLRGFHYADWLALDNPDKATSFGGTDRYFVASAYYRHCTYLTARAAEALGDEESRKKYDALSEEIKLAMQREYFTPTGRIAEPTQTAMLLALAMDIAPQDAKERLKKDLLAKIEARRMHLDTGFVGTYYLMSTLTQAGLGSVAYTLLLNEDYPSWLYEVNMGATTIWERWNSVLPNGLVSDTGMNSMNHYAYGSVVEWMYRSMCGLNPQEPGFASARLEPKSDPRFAYAHASYESVSGRYACGWEREPDGTLCYRVEVPFGASATFVPERKDARLLVNGRPAESSGELMLGPGSYRIEDRS